MTGGMPVQSRNPLFDRLREAAADDPAEVYGAIGVDLLASGANWTGLCPLHDDRNPSFAVFSDGRWRCWACDIGGDAVNLHARMTARHAEPGGHLAAARDLAALLGLQPDDAMPRTRPVRPVRDPRGYPPADEVAAVWDAALTVCHVPEAAAWLRSRGLDPGRVADLDLARGLRPGTTLPRWTRTRAGSWADSGYLLVVKAFDHAGQAVSLHVRCVAPGGPPEGVPKGLWPSGCRSTGLVLADVAGRDLLRRRYRLDTVDAECGGMTHSVPVWRPGPVGTVVLAEGLPDWLTVAARPLDDGATPLRAWGVGAGSATAELAARIPVGVPIVLATHADCAGDRYAAAWWRLLPGRSLRRINLREDGDNEQEP